MLFFGQKYISVSNTCKIKSKQAWVSTKGIWFYPIPLYNCAIGIFHSTNVSLMWTSKYSCFIFILKCLIYQINQYYDD